MKTHFRKLIFTLFIALAALTVVGPTPTYASHSQATLSYRVKRGDTLYSIAWRYGTTVSAIKSANGLRSSNIYVNQLLRIPSSGSGWTPAPTSSCASPYRVRSGDTLSAIARRYGVSVSRIKSLNGLKSSSIYVGQTLCLSGSPSSSQGDSPSNDSLSGQATTPTPRQPAPPSNDSLSGQATTPTPRQPAPPTPEPPKTTCPESIPTPIYRAN